MNLKRYPQLLMLALVGALSCTAVAAPLSSAKAKALQSRFESRQKETRTWSANFTQTLAMSGLRAPVRSEGTISFRAPGDLRISFTQPAGEYVLVLGDRLLVQKPGKRLAEKSLSGDTAGKPFQSLLGLLQGKPSESEQMYDSQISDEGDTYVIVLSKKPEAGGRVPKRITTILSGEALEIREVTVEFPNGGTLNYSFRSPARNRPLDKELFSLPEVK